MHPKIKSNFEGQILEIFGDFQDQKSKFGNKKNEKTKNLPKPQFLQ